MSEPAASAHAPALPSVGMETLVHLTSSIAETEVALRAVKNRQRSSRAEASVLRITWRIVLSSGAQVNHKKESPSKFEGLSGYQVEA